MLHEFRECEKAFARRLVVNDKLRIRETFLDGIAVQFSAGLLVQCGKRIRRHAVHHIHQLLRRCADRFRL